MVDDVSLIEGGSCLLQASPDTVASPGAVHLLDEAEVLAPRVRVLHWAPEAQAGRAAAPGATVALSGATVHPAYAIADRAPPPRPLLLERIA